MSSKEGQHKDCPSIVLPQEPCELIGCLQRSIAKSQKLIALKLPQNLFKVSLLDHSPMSCWHLVQCTHALSCVHHGNVTACKKWHCGCIGTEQCLLISWFPHSCSDPFWVLYANLHYLDLTTRATVSHSQINLKIPLEKLNPTVEIISRRKIRKAVSIDKGYLLEKFQGQFLYSCFLAGIA